MGWGKRERDGGKLTATRLCDAPGAARSAHTPSVTLRVTPSPAETGEGFALFSAPRLVLASDHSASAARMRSMTIGNPPMIMSSEKRRTR